MSVRLAILPPQAPVEADQPRWGEEDNLLLAECRRCQEPRYHLCRLVASYPLANLWLLACGECGCRLQGWESVGGPRWQSPEEGPAPGRALEL